MKQGKICRLVVFVFFAFLLLGVLPSPVLAAPMLTVTPSVGAVGTLVTVTGTNFDSYKGDNIFIFFDSVEVADSPLVVPETGSFTFSFHIPDDAVPGGYWIKAKSELGSTLARTPFTVPETEIELDIKTGVVGTEVKVEGKGFYADRRVILYYDNEEKLGMAVAGPTGEFGYSFTIPESTAGKHKITAENAEGNSAEAEFEVFPLVSLKPTSGAIGEVITISGTGFGYRKVVGIFFEDTLVAYARTDEYGSFEVAFNVPALAPASYEVKAEDAEGNIERVEFTLTAGATLSQTIGSVGSELIVSGTGFMASGAVTIKYDEITLGTITADSRGAFRVSFKVPVSKYGNHIITVSDGVNTRELVFAVEWEAPPAPLLLSPSNAGEARAEAYFDWRDVRDPSLPVTYHLQVASDKSFTSLVLEKRGLTESEYTLTREEKLAAVEKETPYYWRVKAIDSATNESKWSSPWSFYVAAPPVPALISPVDGSKAEAETYFDWEDVTNLSPPITYHLQVASDKSFTSLVLEKRGLTESEYTLTREEKLAAVKKEVPYYWRVKAIDNAGNESEWSSPWSFYVGFSFALPSWAVYILIGFAVILVGFVAFLAGRKTAYYQP